MKKVLLIISFVFAFVVFSNIDIDAKTSGNEVFEVSIGDESLPIYYVLVENQVVFNSNNEEVGNLESGIISMYDGSTYLISDDKVLDEEKEEIGSLSESTITMKDSIIYTLGKKEIKERIQFNVNLKGLSESSNSYKWEHQLCYKVNGNNEVCEIDITGDGDSSTKILSNGEYPFYFYDGHMPYYSESLSFEYITFKNKLVCLDCETSEEYNLNDVSFNSAEINYNYSYMVDMEEILNNGFKYIENYYNRNDSTLVYSIGLFMNNSSGNLKLDGAPDYKIKKEICVGNSLCTSEYDTNDDGETVRVITPYDGGFYLYFKSPNLIYNEGIPSYDYAKYKVTLECVKNCDSSRVSEEKLVLVDDTYYFDYTKPSVDETNTIIDSYDEIQYIKSSETRITVVDNQTGIDENSLKYYMVRPYGSSCSWGSSQEYSFVNGELFNLGEGLSGGYCMYYVAYDKNGNYYTSDYHIYYFDNSAPSISYQNSYDSSKYYNSIVVNPTFRDGYSGIKSIYYLWSKDIIVKENYELVKENGMLFDTSVSSIKLNEDGSYYLYFVAYDNLDNYEFYDLGLFNLDTISLQEKDVIVEIQGFEEGYSNNGTIKISVNEMEDNEEFKCGFFVGDNVNVSDLSVTCYNNQIINLPTGLEGNYNFFINVHDRANNYSMLNALNDVKIDTKAPSIEFDLMYDDNEYHIVNEITLNVVDLSGINVNSLKYGWFLSSKNNVLSSDLTNDFVNGESFGYPVSYYGEYKLYVLAIDNAGNEVFRALDKIFKIDTDVVRISLVGKENITLLKGEKYEELGAVAYKGDVISGGRVSDIKVEGSVDVSNPGVYYITYSSGEGDLLVSVTRKVIVKSDSSYIIVGVCLFGVGLSVICFRLFIRRKKN